VHHLQEILGNEKFLALSRAALFTAIGPVTEEALRKAKVERVRTAEDATVGAVLEALTDYFRASELKMPAGVKPK
jgi:uroporphyrinogen-III synthase